MGAVRLFEYVATFMLLVPIMCWLYSQITDLIAEIHQKHSGPIQNLQIYNLNA